MSHEVFGLKRGFILAAVAVSTALPVAAASNCEATDLLHRWSFNGSLADECGGNDAVWNGSGVYWDDAEHPTAVTLAGGSRGTGAIALGTGCGSRTGEITLEIWGRQNSVQKWGRVFDWGIDTSNYLLLTWTSSTTLDGERAELDYNGAKVYQIDNSMQPYTLGTMFHISLRAVQRGNGGIDLTWQKRDALTGAVLNTRTAGYDTAWPLESLDTWQLWLGRSFYSADSDAAATYDEVRVWKSALSDNQLEWSARLGPDTLPTAAGNATTSAISVSVIGPGTVAVGGSTIDGTAPYSATVARSSSLTLVATPAAGMQFLRWTGDTARITSGTATSTTISIDAARDGALVAEFISSTTPITATWTGGANNGDPTAAANWECRSISDAVIPNAVPTVSTAVTVAGDGVKFNCPVGTAFACHSFTVGNVTLAADCDWRGVGTLTIAGTINLAEHNLQLPAFTGAGAIDNPYVDLTQPGGSASSTTTFLGGNAGNLFNNNFARNGTDNTRRIIVQKAKLPLVVDYDFGAGNAKVVNMYKVYCGPISNYEKRCPKSWTFEGSNDNANWTVLDTRAAETGWAATECRTKTFENTTAYRYYRFKATAAQDNTDGYLEMVQLEYFGIPATGELGIEVPENVVVDTAAVAISGKIKVSKGGAGTLMASKANQTYSEGTHILAGLVKSGNGNACTGTGAITIEAGGTLDVYGSSYFYQYPITLAGGTVANTGTALASGVTQLSQLTLTADSYFNAQRSFGMINASHGVSTIDLGGHTLNVTIGQDAVFRLDNTDVVDGTLKVVENHGVISLISREVRTRNAVLDFTDDTRCYIDSQIGDLILRADTYVGGSPPAVQVMRIFGKLTLLTDRFGNMEMQDGSTLDIAAYNGMLNVVNETDDGRRLTFASNSTITVNLEGRTPVLGEKLVRWPVSEHPSDTVTFQFDAATALAGVSPVVTDTGIFYGVDPDSTQAEYAWWTGGGHDGDLANPANWNCKNVAGNTIPNGLPCTITTIKLDGLTDIQLPAGFSLDREAFDFTGCRLAADCDWRGFDKFTLKAGEVIDLNGYKLYVNGLYGEGEVTGGEFDLTSPSGLVSSPTTFLNNVAVAPNLFNNNFARNGTDNTKRIILDTQHLPLIVDYDFGTPTYVDEYALYVGPEWTIRSPKTWKFYGSNDGTNWTELDARTVPLVGDSALCRRYGIAAPAEYRHYRWEVTESHDASYLEAVQLEYGDTRTTGELHVTVPEGETLDNSTVSLTGNLKLVKEGLGTFVATKSGQTYCGGTEVVAGLLRDGAYGYNSPFGNAGTITVGSDARYNMYRGAFYSYPFVLEGGTISSLTDFTGNGRTIPSLTLTADSAFDAMYTCGLVADTGGDGNRPSTLDLGGHTLDVAIGNGKAFRLKNTDVYNGLVRVTENAGIFSFIDTSVRAETADFELKGEVRCHCPTTVRNLTLASDVYTKAHNPMGTISVLGTFKTASSDFPTVKMLDGSTLDLCDWNGAFAVEGTSAIEAGMSFADGATVRIDVRGRRFENGAYVVTWEEPPANLASLTFKVVGDAPYSVSVGPNGIRLFCGLIISIR